MENYNNKMEMVNEAARFTLHVVYKVATRSEKKALNDLIRGIGDVDHAVYDIANEIIDGGAIELTKAEIIIAIKSVLKSKDTKKKRVTMLDEAIERKHGKCVIRYVVGMHSYRANGNLYRAIVDLGLEMEDLGKTWDVAVGAHRRSYFDGFQMAIVAL